MSNITIPFWIFALSIGVPSVTILCLLGTLLSRIRTPEKDMFANMYLQHAQDRRPLGQPFHNELLHKQIDAIFNGLNTIIETEKFKLKTLLDPDNNILFEPNVPTVASPTDNVRQEPQEVTKKTVETAPTLEQQIVNLTSSGDQLEEMATDLGLSQAELDLAKKMRSSRDSNQGQKLEAVA